MKNLIFFINSKSKIRIKQSNFKSFPFGMDSQLKLSSFSKTFTSNNKKQNQPKEVNSKQSKQANFEDIRRYIKPYFSSTKLLFISTISVTVLAKALIAISPYFLKLTIDSLIAKEPIKIAFLYLIGFFLSKTIGTSILEYRIQLMNHITNDVLIKFTDDMLKYLFKMEYKDFKNNSNFIINSFNKSSQGLENLNRFVLNNVISNVIEFGLVSFFLFYFIGIKYCAVTIGTYALYMFLTQRIISYRNPIMNEKLKLEIAQESKISEIIYNIDSVKYFHQEKKEVFKTLSSLKTLRLQDNKVVSSLAFLNSVQGLVITSGMLIGLMFGTVDCYNGKTSPGDLIMLHSSFTQIMQPLFFLGTIMRMISETRVRLQFAIDMLKNKEMLNKREEEEKGKKIDFQKEDCRVLFENVSFSYDNKENYILKDLNMEFKKGSITAIVGKSGQGKSTIFNMIYRLYSPSKGRILIDNQDISYLNDESFRKYISICPQNGSLFNESIRYNIGYPLEDNKTVDDIDISKNLNTSHDDTRIDNISKDMNIYDKLYANESIGTLGNKLSGGEKQRVLLARGFINENAEIIILDEPTSNLDSQNERIVMNYLMSIKKEKTIIICTHKLNTLSLCDMIYVINNGTIEESGTHRDLLEKEGSLYSVLNRNYFSNH